MAGVVEQTFDHDHPPQFNSDMSPLTLADLHKILSETRRIHLIELLAEHDGLDDGDWIPQSDLTEPFAERVGFDPDDEEERTRAYTNLYHVHFPKLAEYGVIERDRDNNTLRRGPAFKSVLMAHNATALSQGVNVDE